jgi:hypothetical protein
LLPELKRAKTRFTKLSKTRFISGLSAGIRERMLKPDICVYSVRDAPHFWVMNSQTETGAPNVRHRT